MSDRSVRASTAHIRPSVGQGRGTIKRPRAPADETSAAISRLVGNWLAVPTTHFGVDSGGQKYLGRVISRRGRTEAVWYVSEGITYFQHWQFVEEWVISEEEARRGVWYRTGEARPPAAKRVQQVSSSSSSAVGEASGDGGRGRGSETVASPTADEDDDDDACVTPKRSVRSHTRAIRASMVQSASPATLLRPRVARSRYKPWRVSLPRRPHAPGAASAAAAVAAAVVDRAGSDGALSTSECVLFSPDIGAVLLEQLGLARWGTAALVCVAWRDLVGATAEAWAAVSFAHEHAGGKYGKINRPAAAIALPDSRYCIADTDHDRLLLLSAEKPFHIMRTIGSSPSTG